MTIPQPPENVPVDVWKRAIEAAGRIGAIDDIGMYDLAEALRVAMDVIHEAHPSVSPDQMQDGKRYRVVFEGEYKFPDYVQEGMLELPTGELEAWHISLATRIEEIGDDS